MTTFAPFDPGEKIYEGHAVIEASAGTGKTYTIAALVARLVAEEGIPIDRILVVTFTRAATAELQGRIRERLIHTLQVLSQENQSGAPDPHLQVLLDADEDSQQRSIERLSEAITRFDRAQIHTIHGFSIRLLAQLGFHSRISPELEPIDIDSDLVAQVVSDLTVARFAGDASDLVDAKVLTDIAGAVAKHLEAEIVPDPTVADGEPAVRSELAHEARHTITRRLRRGGRAGYDQFLLEARHALTDPKVGEDARGILSERFSIALVDESQDTDPMQWDVINAVFDESQLVIIGDPKQSIYAFRGADIDSYLSSVGRADVRRTLNTNWRSDGPLIKALDALMDGETFGDDQIRYRQVEPSPNHLEARVRGPGVPLTIRRFAAKIGIPRQYGKDDNPFNKEPSRTAVAVDVASETVRLLTSGHEIDDTDGFRPIEPGDIAVLCRTGYQIEHVRKELAKWGVPSVVGRSGNVFSTEAASEWRRFLLGVERSGQPNVVRYSASGILVGIDLVELAELDDDATIELQQDMKRWNALLASEGVSVLVGDLARRTSLIERVLNRSDGERFMTDLMHVAEAMQTAWSESPLRSVLAWLEDAIHDARSERSGEESEARQRRLETDADAVQVSTIHGAKGLEYPIVLCPFLWDGRKPTEDDIPVFNQLADDGTRRRLVDVGGDTSPGIDDHRAWAMEKSIAEESRSLYVALTRAEHRLIVWWLDQGSLVEETKIHELLTRGIPESAEPFDLSWLEERSGRTIELQTVREIPDVARYEPSAEKQAVLSVAEFDRRLDYEWQRASFTSLSPGHPIAGGRDTDEEPDREDETVDAEPGETPAAQTPLPMANLPRGAAFGTLVHSVFEDIAFDSADLERTVRAEVGEAVQRGSWDLDVDALVGGIVGAIETPLGPDAQAIRLRDLPQRQTLDEMRFEFPVRRSGRAMNLGDVADVLRQHLPSDDPHLGYAALLDALPGNRFRGYLTGAIDLTAKLQSDDGVERYVTIDYKTNTLPMRAETPAATDYAIDPMRKVMEDSHYILQSLIYQVALHRYLQQRLPDYDPHEHLGGSKYLFVRGMIGADTPNRDGERCGVFRWNPPAEVIIELSRRFAEGKRM